ncbi:MAG: aldo/keto reductase [Kineosporiaceae bacterium]
MSFGDTSRGFAEWSLGEDDAQPFFRQGVGSLPYSPLAQGRVCRPWGERTTRMDHDPVGHRFDLDDDAPIVDAVQRIAETRGVPMAQVALAWVLRNPVVTAPIVGATKPHHLTDAVAALDLTLTDDEVTALEEHYRPHSPTAF